MASSLFAINLLLDLTFNDESKEGSVAGLSDLKKYIPIRVLGEEWDSKSHTIPGEIAILMKEAWENPSVQTAYNSKESTHRLPDTTD